VALDTASLLGWRATLWDSRGATGGMPLAVTQVLAAGQTLTFTIAVHKPNNNTNKMTNTITVRALSQSTATAYDSATATVALRGRLLAFRFIDPPAAIYAGVPFNVTIRAYDDTTGLPAAWHVMTEYTAAAVLLTDTGTVAPGAAPVAGGVCLNLPVTVSNCIDTVNLGVHADGIACTVPITVIDYGIALDKAVYRGLTDLMRVTVRDSGQDTPGLTNRVRVQVTSDADAAGITVTLTETGLNTGIFSGDVRFTQGGSQAGTIKVNSNGNITVTYDPDGAGGAAAVTAQVSWVALVIADLDRVRSWPNPFRPDQDGEIVIHNLPSDAGMVIEVYNTAAQLLRTLRVGEEISVTPQENVARWDGRSESGGTVASGTYVYVVKSAAGTVVRKLTIIR